ncbi:MAG: glycosyltransferase family A protein [Halomonas sp.]|uniref:glycosyltransferase family A protein n=1 Tax=Halomonas sp. TaxID=1486246 RepID=UPI002870AA41|nr:glycosyltransferase family A protein [Halomonas sp.]MDR9438008.1 glycosyltransferase family A protein [Halomonas sp.]
MIVCSILLDVRSAGPGLPRRLADLKPFRQRRDLRVEVILADDTEDPRLRRLANQHDARIVTTEGTPLGDHLNTAVAHCQGQALLFSAGEHAISADSLVRALADIEQHSQDAVVLTTSSSGRLVQLWQRLRHQTPAGTLCISRAWFERIGGCDPALDADALPDLIERLRACQARISDIGA